MSGYEVARLEEIEEIDDGREPYRPVRHHLGITAFGITSWTGKKAGDRIINEHAEDQPGDSEELYVVVSGHARFEVGGDTVDAPEGTLVFVAVGPHRRTAYAEEDGTTVLAIGAPPGQAYEATGWELWMPLGRLYAAGDYEGVIEQGRELIEANPQYALPLYNLACCEALAGRKEDATQHLRAAIERWPRARELARTDSDLDSLRNDPAFEELVA